MKQSDEIGALAECAYSAWICAANPYLPPLKPTWDELPAPLQRAWESAIASVILRAKELERERI